MIVDFHTHCYPDALAERAVRSVTEYTGVRSDGTYAGLRMAMARAGVDKAVVLPVCSVPGREEKVDSFVLGLPRDGVIPFVSVHPHTHGAPDMVRAYAEAGVRGIKLHPVMQGFDLTDPDLPPLLEAARDSGMITLFHCGRTERGVCSPRDYFPSDFARLAGYVDPERTVLAHSGGYDMPEGEEDVLADLPFLTDTSLAQLCYTPERYGELFARLGARRVLFGSDSPWCSERDSLAFLRAAGIEGEDYALVTGGNAARLLGLTT